MKPIALKANDKLTNLAKKSGCTTWNELLVYIRDLPYKPTSNKIDLSLVMTEKKGTCGSKHAYLKEIAEANGFHEVKLVLAIVNFTATNKPQIAPILKKYKLNYYPEAHCFLRVKGKPIDVTDKQSSFETFKHDIVCEQQISPNQIGLYKQQMHDAYLTQWIKQEKNGLTLKQIKSIRRECLNACS